MSEHLTKNGEFLSDKFRVIDIETGEDVSKDKLVLSFWDKKARWPLQVFSMNTYDRTLGDDVSARLRSIGKII